MKQPTQEQIHAMAQKTITDKEFSDLLREMVDINQKWIKDDPKANMMFRMYVFTRADFNAKLEPIIMFIDLPEIGAEFNRYKMFFAMGFKYHDEYILKKESGKKRFPIATFFNSEAWMRIEKEEGEIEKHKGKDWGKEPTPDQKEGLVTFGMTMDKRVNMASMIIERGKNGEKILGEPMFQDWNPKQRMESDLLLNFYLGFMKGMQMQTPMPDFKNNL